MRQLKLVLQLMSLPRQNQKLSKDEFRKLQDEWYKRLSNLGFKDIEKRDGEDFVLSSSASDCYRGADEFTRVMKAEYFRALAQAALDEDTVFRNEVHRHVLIRYAEGAKIKDIVIELEQMGDPRCRHTIRYIIRRYEMEWGIRHYTNRQLYKREA